MFCQNTNRLLLQFHITGRCNLNCKHCYRTEGNIEPLTYENIVEVIEREPGSYPSAGEVAEIIDKIKGSNAKAIFVEPQYLRTAADTISRETGIPVYSLDPIVSGNLEKEAYEELMRENLKSLVEALEE